MTIKKICKYHFFKKMHIVVLQEDNAARVMNPHPEFPLQQCRACPQLARAVLAPLWGHLRWKSRAKKVVGLICHAPIPSPSSNPSFKKQHSFQNKEKSKNWSKSPQNRERTRLGNCSLLLPQREHGETSRGTNRYLHTRGAWGGRLHLSALHTSPVVLKQQFYSYKPGR